MISSKGQLGLTIISMIFLLIVGFLILNFLPTEINNFRNSLSCSSADTITDSTKLLCLAADLAIPLWIFAIIGSVISLILARLYL